jgi:hypothetical protein
MIWVANRKIQPFDTAIGTIATADREISTARAIVVAMMLPNESPPEDVESQATLSIIRPPIAPLPSDIAHHKYGPEAIA